MRHKKIIVQTAAIAAAAAQASPAFAGVWVQPSASVWNYREDNAQIAKSTWKKDGDKWYYFDENGTMVTGWRKIGDDWYFMNTVHDGTFGAMLKGWQWIDGYCYYFDASDDGVHDGKLVKNRKTPDGYEVNGDGAWTKNGQAVYIAGNGIITHTAHTISGQWKKGTGQNEGRWWWKKPDGTWPSSSWQWLDGNGDGIAECYYFDAGGWLVQNGKTPDGYTVNADGAWTTDGSVEKRLADSSMGSGSSGTSGKVSQHTFSGGSSGGGGGSSSGGGSRHSSGGGGNNSDGKNTNGNDHSSDNSGKGSTPETFHYRILYEDMEGNVLSEEAGTASANGSVTVSGKAIDGYDYVSGAGASTIAKDDTVIILRYQKKKADTDEEQKTFSYTVRYLDTETGDVLAESTGSGEENTEIEIEKKTFNGYTPADGNLYTRVLGTDGAVFEIRYEKAETMYSYEIRYIDEDTGDILYASRSTAEKGAEIAIPEKELDGYTAEDDNETAFTLTEDNAVITVRYKKIKKASDSDLEKPPYQYTIRYIDKDTNDYVRLVQGSAEKGTALTADEEFDDYEYVSDENEWTLEKQNQKFNVYLVEKQSDTQTVYVPYTIIMEEDANGKTIKTIHGSVSMKNDPVEVTEDLTLAGYERVDSRKIIVYKDSDNIFVLRYRALADTYVYTVHLMDIDTGLELGTRTFQGAAGETVDFTGLSYSGYDLVAGQPESDSISSEPDNNQTKIYFKKHTEEKEEKKEAHYVIQFVDKDNEETKVRTDLSGVWTVSEKMPVYFDKTFNAEDGTVWEAVDESPRIFDIYDQEVNQYKVYYRKKGEIVTEDPLLTYTIRYIAEDTGAILGISTGTGHDGDKIAYRNSFTGYSFRDSGRSLALSKKETSANTVDVVMKRTQSPGHTVNAATGKYDGHEWLVTFLNTAGEHLLPAQSGFSVIGDDFYLDYPSVIEKDGVTYRAEVKGPLHEIVSGTVRKNYVIRYVTGDSSEDKLTQWENTAHQASDEFFKTKPAFYYVSYKERNQMENDIGLEIGVGTVGQDVAIQKRELDGWVFPEGQTLGHFTLDKNGITTFAEYDTPSGISSSKNLEYTYKISVQDTDGNNLMNPYSGKIYFETFYSNRLFKVYYPNEFTDENGDIWTAVERSPKTFTWDPQHDTDGVIQYRKKAEKSGEEFLVTNGDEVSDILRNFGSRTFDADSHSFYVIGKNYDPSLAEVSSAAAEWSLSDISTETVDAFTIGDDDYTVVKYTYHRTYDEDTCTHVWEYVHDNEKTCNASAEATIRCEKCGKTVTIIKPAAGHVDENNDGTCDVCGTKLKKTLYSTIDVTWDSGDLGLGKKNYTFICIDDDYNGTGNMLYMMEDGIGKDVFGKYSITGNADYESSHLKDFLLDEFVDGLSVKNSLIKMDDGRVSLLSKEEFDKYKADADNKYPFPDEKMITRTSTKDSVTLSYGMTVSADQASDELAYPVIMLPKADAEEGKALSNWDVGDLQVRTIAGKQHLFRCVTTNYKDTSGTDKAQSYFLCEDIIPSSELLGYDADEIQLTRFFGKDNNYRNSDIKTFLEENTDETRSMTSMNIGVSNEYTGETKKYAYGNFSSSDLTAHKRSTPQVMYSKIFIPSLEEMQQFKDYLFRFNGAEGHNEEDVVTPYTRSYWLRTPEFGTEDMIYVVDLDTGNIHPKAVGETEDEQYSTTGIRPAYVLYNDVTGR